MFAYTGILQNKLTAVWAFDVGVWGWCSPSLCFVFGVAKDQKKQATKQRGNEDGEQEIAKAKAAAGRCKHPAHDRKGEPEESNVHVK